MSALDKVVAEGETVSGWEASNPPPIDVTVPFLVARDVWRDHFEQEHLKACLRSCGRDTAAISVKSGMSRSRINRLLRKHNL